MSIYLNFNKIISIFVIILISREVFSNPSINQIPPANPDISNQIASPQIDLNKLDKPYSDLKSLMPFESHGWYMNAQWIEKLVRANNVKKVLEIGSWLGTSTRHIASILPEDGKIYAVDTWEGSPEHYKNEEWRKFLPTLYHQFLSNVVHAGLTHKIIPLKMSSLFASLKIPENHTSFDLIYIDAGHETESLLQDLNLWFPFVKGKKGIICGDDWSWESVRIAVKKFAMDNNLTVYYGENFWFLGEDQSFSEKEFLMADETIWKRN